MSSGNGGGGGGLGRGREGAERRNGARALVAAPLRSRRHRERKGRGAVRGGGRGAVLVEVGGGRWSETGEMAREGGGMGRLALGSARNE
jgi:hypothetical protein